MPFHTVVCKSKGSRMWGQNKPQSWVAHNSPAGPEELGSMRTPCHEEQEILILSCHPVDVPSLLIAILCVCNLGLICVSPLFLWQLFPHTATDTTRGFVAPQVTCQGNIYSVQLSAIHSRSWYRIWDLCCLSCPWAPCRVSCVMFLPKVLNDILLKSCAAWVAWISDTAVSQSKAVGTTVLHRRKM